MSEPTEETDSAVEASDATANGPGATADATGAGGDEAVGIGAEAAPPPAASTIASPPAAQPTTAAPDAKAAPQPPLRDLATLPNYSRSLLKISVPVSVQLAAKKELVQEVIGLAPGSIIKFEKGCEELLQMIVGEHTVAEGEAVKIGDKFGFRVTSMVMPPEHFVPVKRPRRA